VVITPQEVKVAGVEPLVFPRDRLLSITPGGPRERDHWSGKMSLGLTLRTGNSEQVDYHARANLQRRTPATRFALDYIGNISSLDGEQTANNHRVNSEFNIWMSRRFFLVLPSAEYLKDPFQNLEYRLSVGGGVGYDIIDRPRLTWRVDTGPAYQTSRFDSVEPGRDDDVDAAAWLFNSSVDWELTSRIDLVLEYRGQYTRREVGETTHHGVATLELELTKVLDLDVSLIWDRISNPKLTAAGREPDPDDFRLVLSLGFDF
jgi:hypothetical protein